MGLEVGGHSETYLNPVSYIVFLRQAEGLAEHYVKRGSDFAFSNCSKVYKYPKAAHSNLCFSYPPRDQKQAEVSEEFCQLEQASGFSSTVERFRGKSSREALGAGLC